MLPHAPLATRAKGSVLDRLESTAAPLRAQKRRTRTSAGPWSAALTAAALLFLGNAAPAAAPSVPGASDFRLTLLHNGFGPMLPHRTLRPGSSGPTPQTIEIHSLQQLFKSVSNVNPILPTPAWIPAALLPNNRPGNHFFVARFNRPIDIDSVLSTQPSGAAVSFLTGSISVAATNPSTGAVQSISGRGFVGGFAIGADPQNPGQFSAQKWVELNSSGSLIALEIDGQAPGLGFPGTQTKVPFPGARSLVDPNSFVFIPDQDGNLLTHETFPLDAQITISIGEVKDSSGQSLAQQARITGSVGVDLQPPAVAKTVQFPTISPAPGESSVDPGTSIDISFTESIQPFSLGAFPSQSPQYSGAVILEALLGDGIALPFTVAPLSPFDLTRYTIKPISPLPGSPVDGPETTISIHVLAEKIIDLASNTGSMNISSSFSTGPGVGIVNAPVAPDAVYIGGGSMGADLAVIDLNGFGAGTGNHEYDPAQPIKQGNSNYPNNPNVSFQGSSLSPSLPAQGSSSLDGGSAGVFSLTKDSNLTSDLLGTGVVHSVADMMLGHALDSVFNNGAPPFGCQQGGGNLCSSTAIKSVRVTMGGSNTLRPAEPGEAAMQLTGQENLISWAPHPNPPPLFPALCSIPQILGQEPTSASIPFVNLLGPNPNFLGDPNINLPPTGLLALEQNAYFVGPTSPQVSITACELYQSRQQVGHFLYIADSVGNEVVVLNSNRMTVLDRIPVPDPTSMAMSPNVDFLAISSSSTDQVFLIDIEPSSINFHSVVQTVAVGSEPGGLAWQPEAEDIFVCNRADSTVSIISGFDFAVRKTLTNVSAPIDVAITPRQEGFGFNRGVYYAWILNGDGSLSLFESGPNSAPGSGIGYDAIIARTAEWLQQPVAIQPDPISLGGSVWVLHQAQLGLDGQPTGLGGGAATQFKLEASITGPIVITDPVPQLRAMEIKVQRSIGSDVLSGTPVDLAFDNQRNLGALPGLATTFSLPSPAQVNSKSLVRFTPDGQFANTNEPALMFVAIEGAGGSAQNLVDVIRLDSNQRQDVNPFELGVQSIPAGGATVLMDYFRQ